MANPLPDDVKDEIGRLLKKGMGYNQIANELGVHRMTVKKYADRLRKKGKLK